SKGRKVYVEGRLQTRSWETSDGQARQTTEVVIDDMRILDSKRSFEEGVVGEILPEDLGEQKPSGESGQVKPEPQSEKKSAEKEAKAAKKSAKKSQETEQSRDLQDKKDDETIDLDDLPF
ncbi:single-stranded DNA-binding protein, partial [Candidatus Curtissbacteria bacterium]|nr:single-stranded DNA-binding protein [Candidatus Curtissbacteria bacterium]